MFLATACSNDIMIAKRKITPPRLFKLFGMILLLTIVIFLVSEKLHYYNRFALYEVIRIGNILPSSQRGMNMRDPLNLQKSRCRLRRLLPSSSDPSHLTACKRIEPAPGSCDVTAKLFRSKLPATCDHQRKLEFCRLNHDTGHSVQCQADLCLSMISVGTVRADNGRVNWQRFNSTRNVENYISSLVRPSTNKVHFGFCYVACETAAKQFKLHSFANEFMYDDDFSELEAVQILLLPPSHSGLPVHSWEDDSRIVPKDININLILTDSVSHQHFLRSLPQTVHLLQNLQQNPSAKTTVIEFDLVQSVRSRTFETLQLLFSGEIDPSVRPFGTLELPPEPLKTEVILRALKQKGYTTLWLEDMCYRWEWGLSKDLRVFNKSLSREQLWERFQKAQAEAGIDSVELTWAMCKILSDNGVPDIFHGPDAICYNGKHQHEYLFEYLLLYQKEMLSLNQPFFSFLVTDVSHEDTGLRVQSIDATLSKYLQQVAVQENTLTILFSDHGNAYGAFVEKSVEGHIEMFHPYIFLIIPETVAARLGSTSLSALLINQHRLVSHLDLHYTLKALVSDFTSDVHKAHKHYDVKRWGLFEIVSPNRTCDHIPRIMPNLCICANFDMEVRKDAYHALFAYLAVGLLNNEIQHQFHQHWSVHGLWRGFGHCQQIHLLDFTNIRKTLHGETFHSGSKTYVFKLLLETTRLSWHEDLLDNYRCQNFSVATILKIHGVDFLQKTSNNTMTLKMDIFALPKEYAAVYKANSSSIKAEVFFISMLAQLTDNQIFLDKVDRLTPYSQVAQCADSFIELKLCMCDTSKNSSSLLETQLPKAKDFHVSESLEKSDLYLNTNIYNYTTTNECLLLIERKNRHGGLFFVANICPRKIFQVHFSLQTKGMHTSTQNNPMQKTVYPGQEILLCMAVQDSPKPDWRWSFSSHSAEII